MKTCSINWRLWDVITKIIYRELFYVILPPNSSCWSNTCHECSDGKKFVLRKTLGAITLYKLWTTIEVTNMQKKRSDNNTQDSNNTEKHTTKVQ